MIKQLNKNNEIIAEFENYNKASKANKIDRSSISKCCKGKRKTAGEYMWKEINIKHTIDDTNKSTENREEDSPLNALRNGEDSGCAIKGIYKESDIRTMEDGRCKLLIQRKTKEQLTKEELNFEAYIKTLDRDSNYIAWATWSSLFGIEIMNIAYDGLIETLKEDGIYKGECKYMANQVKLELDKFMGNIHRTCYKGDEYIVIEEAMEYEIDILKLRLSISNYLHKFKVERNASFALVKLCQGMTDLIQSMHEQRKREIKKLNTILDFSNFMKPTSLSYKINNLSQTMCKLYNKNVADVNLNDDICVMNGVYALENKINDVETIKNLIIKIYEDDNRCRKERK